MEDCRLIQTVKGIRLSNNKIKNKNLVIRYTSDENGKTLSIANENDNVMYIVPFDQFLGMIIKNDERIPK